MRYSGTAALSKGLTVEEKSRFFPGWVVRLGVNVVIYLAFHTVARAGRHRSLHSMWFSESEQCRRPFFSAVIFLFSRPACPIATKFTAKSGPAATIQSRRDSSWKCVARSYLEKSATISMFSCVYKLLLELLRGTEFSFFFPTSRKPAYDSPIIIWNFILYLKCKIYYDGNYDEIDGPLGWSVNKYRMATSGIVSWIAQRFVMARTVAPAIFYTLFINLHRLVMPRWLNTFPANMAQKVQLFYCIREIFYFIFDMWKNYTVMQKIIQGGVS